MEENEQTIDLRVLLKVLKDHLLPIVASALVAAAVGFVLSALIIPKKYTSEAMMYVENSADQTTSPITTSDMTAAQQIVNTCQILFTNNDILGKLKASFDDYSVGELKDMIVIEAVNNTAILKISVTNLDPQTSADMATTLVELSINEFKRVIKNGSIEVVASPEVPKGHTFPSIPKFSLIGLLIGLVVSYVVFLVIELVDVKVKPGDDLMQMYEIPVFAEIMDFEISDKSSYKYHYYSTSSPETTAKTKQRTKSTEPLTKRSSAPMSSAAEKSGDKRKENA